MLLSSSSPLRSLSHYRELTDYVNRSILVAGFLARAPQAMMPLGIMTAFTAASGEIAVGGLATGVFSVAVAIFSPLIGRGADLWGQRTLLLALTPLNALAILSLFWAASNGRYGGPIALLWFLAGATAIPVGSFARARWVNTGPPPGTMAAAFSYESVADELVFVLGPALVGIAASTSAPAAPLLLAFLLALVAGIPFALRAPQILPKASMGTAQDAEKVHPSIFRVVYLVAPASLALIFIGMFFGSLQAATTELTEALGQPSRAGLVYATVGIGSAVAALLVVALPTRFRMSHRLLVFGTGMAGTIFWAAQQQNLGMLALIFLLTGLFVGPSLVTAFTLTEKLAPQNGISVAMTLLQSSVTVGVATGSAAGGAVAQNWGSYNTFMLAAAAGIGVALVGALLLVPHYRSKHYQI